MEHYAIDLGGRESQICIRDEQGQVVQERRVRTTELGRLLSKRAPSRVIVETCSEAFAVAEQARDCQHEVKVVPATLVKTLGVGRRGVKNDRRDAQVLSEVSCRIELPSVHVPSAVSRHRKSLCCAREALIRCRTLLVNSVRGYLRTQLVTLRGGRSETFVERVRQTLVRHPEGLSEFVDWQLESLETLNAQIAQADQALWELAKQDETCRRLMSAPGVGPVTAVRFVAAIDDVQRFAHAHALESYLGLVPGERSSGQRQRRTGITKAGSSQVRWALIQASWCLLRARAQGPLSQWAKSVAQRRGKAIAVVATARKLAGILFAMWRDNNDYDPLRAATLVTHATSATAA